MNTRLAKRRASKKAMVALYPDLFTHPISETNVEAYIRLQPQLDSFFGGLQKWIVDGKAKAKSISLNLARDSLFELNRPRIKS